MKLIDKDKIVVEIERRIKCITKEYQESQQPEFFLLGKINGLENLLSFLNTIETKEIDLKKEFYDFLDTLTGKDNGHLSEDELFRIAEYFYELGLTEKGE